MFLPKKPIAFKFPFLLMGHFTAILKLVQSVAMSDQSPLIVRESSWYARTNREEIVAEVARLPTVCVTFRLTT